MGAGGAETVHAAPLAVETFSVVAVAAAAMAAQSAAVSKSTSITACRTILSVMPAFLAA